MPSLSQLAIRASQRAESTYSQRLAKSVILSKSGELNRTSGGASTHTAFNADSGSTIANGSAYKAIGKNFLSTSRIQISNGAAYSLNRQ